jgi:hypothetical protein
MTALFIMALQYIVSAKAGYINYVDGQVNVQLHEQIAAGMPIETGPRGHVEVLLNPGSFLRVGQQSRVVLDSIDLTNISVQVLQGAAVVEVADVDKHAPIRVTSGNLRTLIVSPGLYRFSGDTAVVVDGKLRTADSSITTKKGQQITAEGGTYVTRRTELAFADDLDHWSAQRTAIVARANALAYRSYSSGSTYSFGGYNPFFLTQSAWLYSPLLTGFTFIPLNNYRSYYGFRFIPLSGFRVAGTTGRPTTSSHNGRSSSSGIQTSQRGVGLSRGGRAGGHR